jgi:hypothetical protein
MVMLAEPEPLLLANVPLYEADASRVLKRQASGPVVGKVEVTVELPKLVVIAVVAKLSVNPSTKPALAEPAATKAMAVATPTIEEMKVLFRI